MDDNTFRLPQVQKQTLSERAYEYLRDAIIYLRIKPGQMVYEAEVAEKLGMSRTPLREAFRNLMMEGLIEVLPQRGVRISSISESKVEEARFIRESLETSVIRQLCGVWDSTQSRYRKAEQELATLLDDQKQAADHKDAAAFLDADERFHHAILRQWGNETVLHVVQHMRGHMNRLRYLMLLELDQMDALVREHELLVQAIVGRDEQAALRVLEHHLRKLNADLPSIAEKFPDYF